MITAPLYVCLKLFFLQLYPAYMCYKALKLNDATQYAHLVIYWMVTTVFLVAEYLADIFFFWVPFYYEMKTVLVLWLILPQTNGTNMMYTQYLEPLLKTHEQQIDQAVIDIQQKIKRNLAHYGKLAMHLIRSFISDSLFKPSEEDAAATAAATAAAAASTNEPAPPPSTTWSPYSLFSTLMAATSTVQQLAQARSNNGTNGSNNNATTAPAEPSSSASSTSSTAGSRLDRVDSYDSLNSLVNNNSSNNGAESSSSSAPAATNESWSGYFASFVWKQQAEKAKQE
ncbi:TB2/DP1, HVA22 family-domain-containing protein [Gongronella butleri]|nr:TB2/DP1, HVA22 family-domain-containing protein [Gongronella butleri]